MRLDSERDGPGPEEPDRRRFLRCSIAGAAALALGAPLGGCSSARAAGGPSSPEASPDGPARSDAGGGPVRGRVALARTSAHPTHREAIERVVSLAGGLGFVRPGQRVLLKPAVNSGNGYPATSDPETVWTLAELVKDAGGVPFVADRTMFLRSTASAFAQTGIGAAAAQAGIEALPLEEHGSVRLPHPLAEHWWGRSVRIYRPVAEADHVISLCTPRTHALGDFTMSLKNFVGVVDGLARLPMHLPWGFKERLAEINLVVRSSLVVMDGREGFADGGPDSGDRVRTGFAAAGSDPVAVDAVGLAFLRRAGANEAISARSLWEIPTLRRAAEIGLGARSGDAIDLVGADADTEAALRVELA